MIEVPYQVHFVLDDSRRQVLHANDELNRRVGEWSNHRIADHDPGWYIWSYLG